jgi:hypothetical protein
MVLLGQFNSLGIHGLLDWEGTIINSLDFTDTITLHTERLNDFAPEQTVLMNVHVKLFTPFETLQVRAVAFQQKVSHVEQLNAEIGIRQLVTRALVDGVLEVSYQLFGPNLKLCGSVCVNL